MPWMVEPPLFHRCLFSRPATRMFYSCLQHACWRKVCSRNTHSFELEATVAGISTSLDLSYQEQSMNTHTWNPEVTVNQKHLSQILQSLELVCVCDCTLGIVLYIVRSPFLTTFRTFEFLLQNSPVLSFRHCSSVICKQSVEKLPFGFHHSVANCLLLDYSLHIPIYCFYFFKTVNFLFQLS